MDLPTPAQISDLAGLLVPGLIITAIRTRAITGSVPDLKDRLVSYGIVSTAYFAVVAPMFHVAEGVSVWPWLWNGLQYLFIPICFGVAAAYFYQMRGSYRLAEVIGLHLAHHLPASWDYAFERLPDQTYLLVTLKNGSEIAGLWNRGSFASSSSSERDILIARMFEIDGSGTWTVLHPPRAILISAGEIRHVEIYGA